MTHPHNAYADTAASDFVNVFSRARTALRALLYLTCARPMRTANVEGPIGCLRSLLAALRPYSPGLGIDDPPMDHWVLIARKKSADAVSVAWYDLKTGKLTGWATLSHGMRGPSVIGELSRITERWHDARVPSRRPALQSWALDPRLEELAVCRLAEIVAAGS